MNAAREIGTMRRMISTFLISISILGLIAIAWFSFLPVPMAPGMEEKHRANYEIVAVTVLALDAARSFPRSKNAQFGTWGWSEPTPCLQWNYSGEQMSSKARRYEWGDWPEDGQRGCEDIVLSTQPRQWHHRLACQPYLVWRLDKNTEASHALAMAEGGHLDALETAKIPAERLQAISNGDDLGSSLGYLSRFVAGGGIDSADVTYVSETSCPGFKIYSFRSKVRDVRALRAKLETVGYFVGVK